MATEEKLLSCLFSDSIEGRKVLTGRNRPYINFKNPIFSHQDPQKEEKLTLNEFFEASTPECELDIPALSKSDRRFVRTVMDGDGEPISSFRDARLSRIGIGVEGVFCIELLLRRDVELLDGEEIRREAELVTREEKDGVELEGVMGLPVGVERL
ncbi:unnamed protein product [Lepeophtheirus salmonis]|uniref:(salmon louse) hypothetical protein n=1 Tax=Lepeophtheirus salmonis TaxID=72036 RepID=A0A7R8D0T4_LEPSM|nr:unnamed protein product [Lepeophtheirus salmonis]CAF2987124.1 unnamed protein product [Lepeophtheirus salmonis]